ncbi:MAG: OmpA family protein [Saprospiraceae bacterium]
MRFTSYIIQLVLVGTLLLSGSVAFGQQSEPVAKTELSKAERKAAKQAAKATENAEKSAAKAAKKAAKSKVITTSTKTASKGVANQADQAPVKKEPIPLKRGTNPSRQATSSNTGDAPHIPGSRPGKSGKRVGDNEAEKTYNDLGYKASIPKYNMNKDLSLDQMVQLATAYRLNHDTENAEIWYAQVVASSDDPIHQYFYAQALQSNGRDQLAKAYFDRYAEAKGEGDKRGEAFAKTINGTLPHSSVAVRNERAINTEHLDFSPSFYQGGVVFVSTRPVDVLAKTEEDIWLKDNFMSLFDAQPNQEKELLEPAEEFAVNLNTNFHEGPLSFDRQGKRLFFTRNTFNKGKRRDDKSGIMRLNIYESVYADGEWSEAEELPWNTDDYEEAHPTLSDDGQTLYFSSNRPGGFGGMDLYMSQFKKGKWQKPVNLGEEVNTKGTDASPFIHPDGSLYFASDGKGGRGGLDIFVMKPTSAGFDAPRNIGTPFNSKKDDFGYILNKDKTYGYFTSARQGGAGQDDIYSFVINEPLKEQLMQTICVYASPDTEQLLPGAEVLVTELTANSNVRMEDEYTLQLKPTNDDDEYEMRFVRRGEEAGLIEAITYSTDASGKVTFPVEAGKKYQVTAVKEGFADNMIELNIPKSAQIGNEDCVPMTSIETSPGATIMLHGKTINKKYGNVLPNVELTLIDMCTGESRTIRSAANGEYTFGCVPCGCEFLIQGSKKYFISDEVMASTMNVDCIATPCTEGGEVVANLELIPDLAQRAPVRPLADGQRQPEPRRASEALGGAVLVAGTIIELKNIYYDFDQHYIRDDAKDDLNHIVSLMREYPGMEIELGSHTDARAPIAYNQALAQRRAEAARQYLMRQGIDNRRIVARGFGESQLRNQCADFVKCTEEEHQVNRRTEVRIIKVGEDVDVRYKDDGPEHTDPADPRRKYIWK